MDAALNPKARPTARERCGDSFAAVLAQLRHGDDLPAPADAAEDPPPKAREST